MRRYYSHYTFIYPDIYRRNSVVEINGEYQITHIFPFEREIERTEFYSGLLIFLPDNIDKDFGIDSIIDKEQFYKKPHHLIFSDKRYRIVHREDFSLSH